jgi:hypothetical protein
LTDLFQVSAPWGLGCGYFEQGYSPYCDCPDHTFHPERPGGCKHMRALAAALAALAQ